MKETKENAITKSVDGVKALNKESVLTADFVCYDGMDCSKETVYKKGTKLSDISETHKLFVNPKNLK